MKEEKQRHAEKVAAARARMAELATKFVTRTRNELVTIRALLAKEGQESFAEIEHLSHRMAGTGATLGFDVLAEHAMRIETIADARKGAPIDEPTRVEIAREIAVIESELKKLRGT